MLQLTHYSDCARDLADKFPDSAQLWQVQFAHDAKPSVAFNILGKLEAYRADAKKKGESVAASVNQMLDDMGVLLRIAGGPDEDSKGIGYKQYRVAFYVIDHGDNNSPGLWPTGVLDPKQVTIKLIKMV